MFKIISEKTALNQIKFMKKYSTKMRLAGEKWKNNWQILISIILSARTRDETTIIVAKKLFKKYPSAKKLSNSKIKEVEKTIKSVNFYRNKSRNIINCSKEIIKNYKGKVPDKIDDLIKLPGVGRKTANVFLSEIGKYGMGVDSHVSYISQKLGWTKNENSDKIEDDLKKLFSKNNWNKVNSALVRFGKTYTSRKEKNKLLEEIKKIK
ncbi:MAG TPA: endonuclease III [Ignavibacteria bacterium]|nr:endonuclease III [Ignavibacteria bacterium]